MPYLRASVESVLRQTYKDFELIIVDDGSTDDTRQYLSGLREERLVLIRSPHAGLVSGLNTAISVARGPILVRMDSDDVCLPNRLEKQNEFMEANPYCALAYSDVQLIDATGTEIGEARAVFHGREHMRRGLLGLEPARPIVHPSVCMRATVLRAVGGYREFVHAEDRDLWLRLSRDHEFRRIPEILLKYRVHHGGISRQKLITQLSSAALAAANELIFEDLGIDPYPQLRSEWPTLTEFVINSASKSDLEAYRVLNEIRLARYTKGLAWALAGSIMGILKYRAALRPRSADELFGELVRIARDRLMAKIKD